MKLEQLNKIQAQARRVKRSKTSLAKSPTSAIVVETLKEFKNDEIGYKSALQKLKDSGCTEKEVKYFINNSLI